MASEVDMLPVNSSNINAIGYDGTATLTIEFKSGKTYSYYGIDPGVYKQLIEADSIGSFFSKNIKNNYQLIN